MTDLQKEMFLGIIKLMKDNEGEYNLYAVEQDKLNLASQIEPESYSKNLQITIKQMKGVYIKQKYENSTTLPQWYLLTNKGWNFSSFEDLEAKEKRDEQIKDLTFKQLTLSIWQVKWWWVFLLINAAISVFTALITHRLTGK